MKKVREKVAIAVAIASITTISSFVISNGKKVYAEEVRVTATANVDNIKDNRKQLKNESPKANTQEDTNVKNEDLKTDEKKDIKEVESNFVKNVENKTEKINEDKSLENNNNKVSTKLEFSDKDVKEIKNEKDSKDKDSKEVKDENVEKVHNNKKDTVEEVENESDQNNEDKINRDKKVEVRSEEIKSKDNETSKRDEESKKIEGENKEAESKLDKNQALKSDYININESGQALTVGTESQNNSVTDENEKNGWQTIGGKTYYFENGKVSTGKKEVYDTKNGEYKTYFFNEDGALVTDTGIHDYCESWGGKRKVYVNNKGEVENGWKTIDGKTYYFDQYNGMSIGVSNINTRDGNKLYLFRDDGELVKYNGWKYFDRRWYYFNGDNSLVNGWKNINGKMYHFDYNMNIGPTKIYNHEKNKEDLYYFEKDGEWVKKKRWAKLNGNWYYFDNDGSLRTGWQKIDGKTYYFCERSGVMETGQMKINDYINNKQITYCFTSDGVLLEQSKWFYKFDDNFTKKKWYYIDNDGKLVKGEKKINGKNYYFNNEGSMATGITKIKHGRDDFKTYCFDENGQMIKKEGWIKVDKKWYYIDNDSTVHNGWLKLGNDFYYLNSFEGMAIGVNSIDYDDKNGTSTSYFFEADGKLTKKTGWISENRYGNETWYYINDDGKLALDWKHINGSLYYFDDSSKMVTKPKKIFDEKSGIYRVYFFDKDGRYNKYVGWYEYKSPYSNSIWYYFGDDGIAKIGWQTINGNKYYFGNEGRMYTGACPISSSIDIPITEGSPRYLFNKSGALVTKKGWNSFNGIHGVEWYYTDENGECKRGLTKINNNWYSFNLYTCKMETGLINAVSLDDNKYINGFFDNSGALNTSKGWHKFINYHEFYDDWCYIDENGELADGFKEIDGVKYHFNSGVMSIGATLIDSNLYYFNESGVMVKGWSQNSIGNYYYTDSEGILQKGWQKINGIWYYFNDYGVMATGPKYILDESTYDTKLYYFDNSGALQYKKGWVNHIGKYNNDWYYINSNNELSTDWQNINGTWYYFHENGKMAKGVVLISDLNGNKKEYCFDNSGAWVINPGWYSWQGEFNKTCWAYINNDGSLAEGWKEINNKWYYFHKERKVMAKGAVKEWDYKIDKPYIQHFFNEDGSWDTSEGWKSFKNLEYSPDLKWAYVESNGRLASGWKMIGGQWYYFDEGTGIMVTEKRDINGKLYEFNSNGTLKN
ncbi:cell wall-binding protein [Clostridium perfringens]|uniref:cell wall-binding protein n=1 Tax=Clostridium perfringens TaxID=1502 RepID=UPI0039EA1C5F